MQPITRRRPLPARVRRDAARRLAFKNASHNWALGPAFAGMLRVPHVLERLTACYVQSSAAATICAPTRFFLVQG